MEGESEPKIQTVSLDQLAGIKEAKYEKPIFEKATTATIVGIPEVNLNVEDKEGITKDGKPYSKLFFTVHYRTEDGLEFREGYGFSLFIDGDQKTFYYGKESSTREFLDVAIQYVDGITKDSPLAEILPKLENRKVKVITKEYGPGKNKKTQVISYL
ncbi:MAG: hypothetical protein PWP52_2343 [Bacteroidales bacterium]|nr:hypothetical protein [Bacteroidales bacterium]